MALWTALCSPVVLELSTRALRRTVAVGQRSEEVFVSWPCPGESPNQKWFRQGLLAIGDDAQKSVESSAGRHEPPKGWYSGGRAGQVG